MTDLYLALGPMLAAGTLALAGFVGCDRVLGFEHVPDPQPPPPTPEPMVDFAIDPLNPPPVRNDYTGWVGMTIRPVNDVTIDSLGRWRVAGNSQAHQVMIVDADTGMLFQNAIVTVPLLNNPDNAFVFAPLASSVQLAANHSYHLLSQEVTGGDDFIDYMDVTVTPTSDVQVLNPVYGDLTATPPQPYTVPTQPGGNCYGPVNATYIT